MSAPASLGRRIAEGQARLIASQAAVFSLERANEGLAAGQAAVALREVDLRAMIESAIDCAIVTTARDGLVLAWNSGAHRLLGWDAADERLPNSPQALRDRAAMRARAAHCAIGDLIIRNSLRGCCVWVGKGGFNALLRTLGTLSLPVVGLSRRCV